MSVLIPHFEELKNNIDEKPNNIVTDAGYGSEENFKYDKDKNEIICPNNKRLKYVKSKERKTDNGCETKVDIYVCENCLDCPLKKECTKSDNNRSIQVNQIKIIKETAF